MVLTIKKHFIIHFECYGCAWGNLLENDCAWFCCLQYKNLGVCCYIYRRKDKLVDHLTKAEEREGRLYLSCYANAPHRCHLIVFMCHIHRSVYFCISVFLPSVSLQNSQFLHCSCHTHHVHVHVYEAVSNSRGGVAFPPYRPMSPSRRTSHECGLWL